MGLGLGKGLGWLSASLSRNYGMCQGGALIFCGGPRPLKTTGLDFQNIVVTSFPDELLFLTV